MINYKAIIKSRSCRLKILRLFSFIPDKPMLKIQYWIKTGRRLNLKNPKRFTEKLQWYKLYYRNPLMIQCVDKYDVRDFVKSKGLEDILIPCYGVYETADEIKWDDLPDQFVMKNTLGGGGSSVIVVKDKTKENIDYLKQTASRLTAEGTHEKGGGREWPYYSGRNSRIIIEKYLESDESKGGLIDYKFFCFDGKPTWIYVISDRILEKETALRIYNENFEIQKVVRNDEKPMVRVIQKPSTFEKMKEVASILSSEFPEARIDLYEYKGKVMFGEITFFDGSGYMTFTPDSFDELMGKNFKLRKY